MGTTGRCHPSYHHCLHHQDHKAFMATSGWATSTVTGFLSSVPGLVDSGLQDTNNDDDSDGDDIDSTIKFGIWSGQQ